MFSFSQEGDKMDAYASISILMLGRQGRGPEAFGREQLLSGAMIW